MNLKNIIYSYNQSSLSLQKSNIIRQSIVRHLININESTISEISLALQLSVPTITKSVNDLIKEGYLIELGKNTTNGGRKASLYGIQPNSAFFVGLEVKRETISIGLQNIHNDFIKIELEKDFILENTLKSLKKLCEIINNFINESKVDKDFILGVCINLSGRINSIEGFSYNFFFNENQPLTKIIQNEIGLEVFLENDTRAMTFGEFSAGIIQKEKNVLFLNYSWGVGIGIITDGKLYYGKSGYSGEFGHSSVFNNEIICQCGKIGCLETEISGWALIQQFKDAIKNGKKTIIPLDNNLENINHNTIIDGILNLEDTLSIDLITIQAEKMGRYLSSLINIFNPELLVIGGDFSKLGDYILFPIKSALKKHSLGLVVNDVNVKISSLVNKAGIIGAAFIVKEKALKQLN